MMKLLSLKSTSGVLLLFAFLSVLWKATGNESTTVSTQSFNITAKSPPESVKNVTITQNETSITLTFEKVTNISAYILEYDGKSMDVNADQKGNLVHVVSSLTAGTKYNFTLFTLSETIRSTGYQFPAVTAPENVKNVNKSQDETSITLTWDKVKDIPTYFLDYGGKSMNVTADQNGNLVCVVSSLTAATKYNFTLFTVFEGINSTGHHFSAVTAPENVKDVKKNQDETSITLTWEKVKNISTYILEYDGGLRNVAADQNGSLVHVVSPLTAGKKYSFTVYTVFEGVKSTGYNVSAATVPGNVEKVDVVTQNETSITLKWKMVANISTYILVYDGKLMNVTADQEGETFQYVVSSLTAGTLYNFTLFTVFDGLNSTGYHFTAATAPENVKNVEMISQDETSITLTWEKVKNILTYILKYDGGLMNVTGDQEGNLIQRVVSPLTAGKKYNFTLFTVFEGINSIGHHFSAVTAPKSVDNVKDSQNETSITLRWNKVGDILTYILQYNSTQVDVNGTLEDDSVQHVVSPLTAGTRYSFTLFTVFEGVNSTGHTFSAATAPENVKDVKTINQNETSITLSWEKVKNISTYILEYNGESTDATADHEGNLTRVVSSLTAATKYNFTLFTVFETINSTGHIFSAVTAPENVKNVTVNQNETSITLTWEKVKNILTYILEYDDGKSMNVTAYQEGETFQLVVPSLTAGTLYYFTLFTVFERVNSTGYQFSDATVPTMASVSTTERYPTAITLQWDSPNKAWEYKLKINASDHTITPSRKSNTLSYSVSKLIPGTLYAFSLITQFSGLNSTAYENITLTTIDCSRVNWHVTNSSIQGTVEGLFSKATATNETQKHDSPGGANVSFIGLYPGATYKIQLTYDISSRSFIQCEHNLTVFPPILRARCEFWASGYSARVVWDKPNGVWTKVEVNRLGETETADGKDDHLIIGGLQPAKKYEVSVVSVSGEERKSEPFVFNCLTDNRGVIAGSFFGVLLFGILVFVVAFIFFKRPDIIKRKKSFIGGSKIPTLKEKPISVAKFPDHFHQLSLDQNRGFSQEYEEFASVGTDQARKAATLPDNRPKNRFTNVLPYDWCRVKLNTSTPSDVLDYINASYMPGYNSKREYIATQGPLPSTVNDFWRMIWEQRVTGIVMVTNCTEGGRTKCEQYWPHDRNPCSYAELMVTVRSEQREPSWTLREFSVKNKSISEERTVKHFHFTAWPDHGVPQDTKVLIQFRGLVRRHIEGEGTRAPTVVHCSAGVGRTGTIIALDVLLQQLEKERAVGINAFVNNMRLNRPYMVQTESQYVFLHQCIMDSLQPSGSDEHIYENTDMIYVNATALRELR